MPRFLYKAKKEPREIIERSIEAESQSVAIKKLTDKGLYPIWVKEESLTKDKTKAAGLCIQRIKPKDVANFTRQLSELLDSGLPLYESLNIIRTQIEQHQLEKIINLIQRNIKDGKSFSDSLGAHPHIFSNLYVNMVRSGETGGVLSEVLSNIADFLEKQEDIKSKITAALAYPILMAGVGLITIIILMTFVVPRLVNMLIDIGETLPLPTRILIGCSDFTKRYWIFVLVFIAVAVFFIKRTKASSIDRLKLKIPLFGNLLKDTELARFSRTLSTLLKNGVPILHGLKISSDVVMNNLIREDILKLHADVKAGSSLAVAVSKRASFPKFVENMAAIGEKGGFLDQTLMKVAHRYEAEADRTIKILSSLLEPGIILVMGVIVGFIVISMLLPVFQISLTVH